MEFQAGHVSNSPSSSSNSSTQNPAAAATASGGGGAGGDPMQSWWESISKARSRIHSLAAVLPDAPSLSLSSLADSDRPALSLLSSPDAYAAVSSVLSAPLSGSGADPLCNWLYDTFLSADPHLRLVVLSYLPLLAGLYLSRVHHHSGAAAPSLAGFEAVLLALYAAETKSRAGKPVHVTIPDLSQPSLYHAPRVKPSGAPPRLAVGVLSAPLEPQVAVKSTKRAVIVGVALDCYYKQISQMPSWSKLEFCRFAAAWAGQDCPCKIQFDDEVTVERGGFLEDGSNEDETDDVVVEMSRLGGGVGVGENGENGHSDSDPKGARIPLPWELLQPVLRILGHCLLGPLNLQDVKDAASVAVKGLYARASHDLAPQAILATRSLIQLDKRARVAAEVAAATSVSSNANTPSKAKKPEVLLASK